MITLGAGVSRRYTETMSLSLLVRGSALSGSVVSDETVTLSINDDPVPATIRHTIDLSLYAIALEPSVLFDAAPMRFRVGLPISLLLNGTYLATQQVVNPPGITIGGVAIQTEGSGTLPGLRSVVPSLVFGMSTDGKLARQIQIEPELTVGVPLMSISSEADWRLWSLRLGVRLTPYVRKPKGIRRDTVVTRDTVIVEIADSEVRRMLTESHVIDSADEERDTVILRHVSVVEQTTAYLPREPSVIRAEAKAMFVDDAGAERDRVTIATARHENELFMPLLPIIYFRYRSSDLTSYDGQPTAIPRPWDTASHISLVAALQFRLLQDWAKELRGSDGIVGVRGSYTASEPRTLADKRAMAVIEQLAQYGVARSRLHLRPGVMYDDEAPLARTATLEFETDRVAMQRQRWTSITSPPCHLRIHLRAEGDVSVHSWIVSLSWNGTTIGHIEGDSLVPEHVMFTIPDSVLTAAESVTNIVYRVQVMGDDGSSFISDPATITMQMSASNSGIRTERIMIVPTVDARLEQAALRVAATWGTTERSRLQQNEAATLRGYGAAWLRIVEGMQVVRSGR